MSKEVDAAIESIRFAYKSHANMMAWHVKRKDVETVIAAYRAKCEAYDEVQETLESALPALGEEARKYGRACAEVERLTAQRDELFSSETTLSQRVVQLEAEVEQRTQERNEALDKLDALEGLYHDVLFGDEESFEKRRQKLLDIASGSSNEGNCK